MKKIFFFFVLFNFIGCDSFLDEVPDNRQEIKTVEDAAELAVLAYSEGSYQFIEWLTDNVRKPKGNSFQPWHIEHFRFETVTSSDSQDTPGFFWENNYKAIAQANQALELLESIKEIDDQKKYNAAKGEALIARAYNHFMLANVFCMDYREENKDALGIPYITKPETSLYVSYERGTLEETYQKIEADILEALPLINDTFYSGSKKYHFNKKAAYAFASRFYLFKKDFEKCIEYSNMLLGDGIVTPESFRDMNDVFSGGNSTQISNQFIDPDHPANLLLVRSSSFAIRYSRGYRSTNPSFDEIFEGNIQNTDDYRDLRYGYGCCDARQQPKFTENFIYSTATTGFGYSVNVDLRAEETLLNRMEAYIMTDQIQKALDDYNVFAPSRYQGGGQLDLEDIVDFYNNMPEKEAMIAFILSERRKEFLNEGFRWFDIKRYDLPVVHYDNIETNIARIPQSDIYPLKKIDLRKAVQIPPNFSEQGIEKNPR